MKFTSLDLIVFLIYFALVVTVGIIFSRRMNKQNDSNSFFFAGNSLPWFIVGSSVIAANISAEQFIGMSGSGFAMGITIASYEWLAAIMLIMSALWFIPVFIQKKIYTMPQFLELRYDRRIKTVLTIFWLFLFIFVNLTSILYLGALVLKTVFGINLVYSIAGLAIFSLILTAGGGLKAIANTDLIQVVFLVLGGMVTTYIALDTVSEGEGMFIGLSQLVQKVPEKFKMILSESDPNYIYMPGVRSIFGGIWIAGIYYFGANQYIIQKALGAKSLLEAQRGLVFASYLKLIVPLLVVIPGIAAFALHADIEIPDQAYPWLLDRFVPSGLKGMVFAALIAAIISSLAAIINSASTIFIIDIFKVHFKPKASEELLVKTGRLSCVFITAVAAFIASFLTSVNQVFQFIQEYTGLVSPGITAIFVLGIFWKITSTKAAWIAVIITLPVPLMLKYLFPELPFLDNMLVSFLIIAGQMIIVTLSEKRAQGDGQAWELPKGIFRMNDPVFRWLAIGILLIISFLYSVFW